MAPPASEKVLPQANEVKKPVDQPIKAVEETKEAEGVETVPVEPAKPNKPPKPRKESPTFTKEGTRIADISIGDSNPIPVDDMARLMYYLHCVKKCVDVKISSRLTNFQYYNGLTETERRDVVVFAHRYRCGVLRKVIFFEVDDDSVLLPNSPNDFLDYEDPIVTGTLEAQSDSVKIDGETYKIHKVMVFKYAWLHDYFVLPFSHEQWRIGLAPKPMMMFKMSKMDGADDVPIWCVGGILCCFIFPPIGLVLLAVGACRAGQESAKASEADRTTTTTTYVVT